jgi:hypothetical protein
MTPTVEWIGSTNKSIGRQGYKPEAIVIHIMEGTLAATDSWFNTPKPKSPMPVSAHYGVGRLGQIHQYVAESDTAWHAGRRVRPTWAGVKPNCNLNLYTIGIEHEAATADTEWTDAMYESSAWLIAGVANRWSISLDRAHVVGHHEIYAPKTCPGNKVDLEQLIDMALSVTLSGEVTNFVPTTGTVTARTRLNLRSAPTTQAQVARTVEQGGALDFVGWTSTGETIHGNPHWYRDASDEYFWAGATSEPSPMGANDS